MGMMLQSQTLYWESHLGVRLCVGLVILESDSVLALSSWSQTLCWPCHLGVRLCSRKNMVKPFSLLLRAAKYKQFKRTWCSKIICILCMTLQSLNSLVEMILYRVWLISVHHTKEFASMVCRLPQWKIFVSGATIKSVKYNKSIM